MATEEEQLAKLLSTFTPEQRAAYEKKVAQSSIIEAPNVGAAVGAVGRSAPVRYTLSGLGKILDVLDTGLNAVTMGARPLVTGLNPNLEKTYQKFEKDLGFLGIPNITPSALVEDAIPGKHQYKWLIKLAGDLAFDPLTYATFGTKTALGGALAKAASAGKEGKVIKLDSKLAKQLAKGFGEEKATPFLIGEAKKGLAKTTAEQARQGQRALVKFAGKTVIKGAPVFQKIDEARQLVRQSKIGSAYNKLFASKSSHPEFEALRQNFVNLVQYRKNQVYATAKAVNDQLDELAVAYDIPRHKVERLVTELAEKPTLTRKITKKIVTRIPGVQDKMNVKQKLVNVLRAIGETKAAGHWEARSINDKAFREFYREFKAGDKAVLRLMERSDILDNLATHFEPLKRLAKDIEAYNTHSPSRFQFMGEIFNVGLASYKGVQEAISKLSTKTGITGEREIAESYMINPVSRYLKQAYKDLPDGNYAELQERVTALIKEDLDLNRATADDVINDLFKKIPEKPKTTKVQGLGITPDIEKIKSNIAKTLGTDASQITDLQFRWKNEEGAAFVQVKYDGSLWEFPLNEVGRREGTSVEKLRTKLQTRGIRMGEHGPEDLISYYSTHYYKPKVKYTTGQKIAVKALHETPEGAKTYRAIRRGQLADILKQSKGDVYQRAAYLINEGLIGNRNLLPSFQGKVRYDESEVLVRLADYDQAGTKVLSRDEFEREMMEVKDMVYGSGQLLPVMHGTARRNIDAILNSGLIPAASEGLGTQTRDITAGLPHTVFASAPVPPPGIGNVHIVLPVNVLREATALPVDGIALPANPMITRHLLTRGDDGILDLLIRGLAIKNWEGFQGLKADLKTFNKFRTSWDQPIQLAERLLEGGNFPDIHLTGSIPPEKFLGVVKGADFDSIKEVIRVLQNQGVDISKLQLLKRGDRFFTRFYDGQGVPLIDKEFLATPDLTKALSHQNILGVGVDAEKQARAVEKFLAKAGIPEGESVFTYLRQTNPNLFAQSIETVGTKEFWRTLENYGLLSDESMDAIAANIFDIREGFGQGKSARELMLSPEGAQVRTRIILNQENFEQVLRDMPSYQAMSLEDKGNFAKMLWRQVKAHERGHDVFTMGLRILPHELQDEVIDLVSDAMRLDLLRTEGKMIKGVKTSEVLRAFSNGGEDAAIEKLLGKKGFARIKKIPADYEHMKSVVHKVAAHVDELFAQAHSLYMINPKKLQKVWPSAFGAMRKIYSRKGWKTQWITENTQIPRKYAQQYPDIFDYAQTVRRIQSELHEHSIDMGAKAAKSTRQMDPMSPVIAREVRDYLLNTKYVGHRGWSVDLQEKVMRNFRNIVGSKVDEASREGGWLKKVDARNLKHPKKGLAYLDRLRKEGKYSAENLNSITYQMTVDEVNSATRLGKLNFLGDGVKFDKFFEDNPTLQIVVRGVEGARTRTTHEFFEAAKQFGEFKRVAPPGYKHVKNRDLAGWAFPEEIADHLDRFHEYARMPTNVHPFLELYDDVQDTWKAWTLSIFPAYHVRNAVGNVWNNFLGGVVNPMLYKRAWSILKRGEGSVETGYGETLSAERIIDLMKRHGIFKAGQYQEIEQLFEKEVKGLGKALRKFNTEGATGAALAAGRKVGEFFEVNAYLAHFIHRLEQGYAPGAAAQSVKKYLFDYGDLTPFEKNVMRRIIPFYTWTRKNMPLQLEALVTQPGKALGVLKAKMAIESPWDGAPDERYLPDWYAQNFPIRYRKDPKTGVYHYFFLGAWLPLGELDKLFQPLALTRNMLSPLIKEPMQQLANRDFFTMREIDEGGEYERFAMMNMPKRLAHLLGNVRLFKEADRWTKKDVDFETKALQTITGKAYPYDEKKGRRYKSYDLEKRERQLRSMLKRARKNKDKAEVERVLKLSRELQMERRKLGIAS